MRYFFAAFFLGILLHSCKRKPETIYPETKTITEAVYASGYLVPLNDYKVFSLADGYLNQVMVKEGDSVNPGQVLFEVDHKVQSSRNQSATEALRIAQENYANNSAVLLELKAAAESARNKYALDSLNYLRYKKLHEQGVGSDLDFNKAELAFKNSRNDLAMAMNRYTRTKNQLLLELNNAESNLAAASQEEGNTFVKSQIRGLVYDVSKKQGEAVRRGEVLAVLGSSGTFYLRLNVDETDISKIKPGQQILVKTDVNAGQVFHAHVTKIYPQMNQVEQSFRVDAEFDDMPDIHFSGTSLEANIIISTKENALVIPKNCVTGGDSITVINAGKQQKIKIKKGVENMDYVEVLDGVNGTTAIVK